MTREEKLAKYGVGPWLDEPDRVEFEWRGLPCLMTRNEVSGHLCGYVAVPPGHRWHGLEWDDPTMGASSLYAHGGVNYSKPCADRVCHVPKPGEPADVWWFGFDCVHAFDFAPMHARYGLPCHKSQTYRTAEYVLGEIRRLAEQLAAAS
jgi:hypothetical protein